MHAEYMKGASHMNIEQYTKAIGSFNKVHGRTKTTFL